MILVPCEILSPPTSKRELPIRRRNLLIQVLKVINMSDIPKVSEFHRLFFGPFRVQRQEAITGTCISTAVLHLQIQ